MVGAIVTHRGCGKSRVVGGIYVETGLSANGFPFEDFLCDPPKPVNIKQMGVTPIGMKIIEINGVAHLIDWIGSESYPNVLDWVNESAAYGISRRTPKNLDFSRLTKSSRLLVIHARGFIVNLHEYIDQWFAHRSEAIPWRCIKQELFQVRIDLGDKAVSRNPFPDHSHQAIRAMESGPSAACKKQGMNFNTQRMCVGAWGIDIETSGDDIVTDEEIPVVFRQTPSVEYGGYKCPKKVTPIYQAAIIGAFPITRLAVVSGGNEANAQESYDLASQAQIDVSIVVE